MEYKKIKKDGYTMHIIDTNRFKSMTVALFFTKKFSRKDVKYGTCLCNNMAYSTKKYNTKNKISVLGENLFGAKISASFGLSGKCESFIFSLDFLNPKYTDIKYLSESLDFLYEFLFNPNVDEGGFNSEYFEIIRRDGLESLRSMKDNPSTYASHEFSKIMYKGTPTSHGSIPSIKDVETCDRYELYEFYKTLFNSEYKIDVVIYGEDANIVEKPFEEKFSSLKGNSKKLTFDIKHKYEDKVIEKIESLKFNQSKLYLGYRLNNLTNHEKNHVIKVYNTILGTMNDSVLFNIVREENSLCYSIGSYVTRYNPSLVIYAGINKDNYEKTVSLIKECMNKMSDRKTIERLFNPAKKTINTYLNNYYDDYSGQINFYYDNEFDYIEDVETSREYIEKVTIDEVIEINKKISLSTIYLLKGDN